MALWVHGFRKMNKNKNLLILYYLWKKLFKFFNTQKKVLHTFPFPLCSTANSKFSFYVSPSEVNCIKIICVLLTLTSPFVSDRNKNMLLYNNWYWACLEILLQPRDFESVNGDPPLDVWLRSKFPNDFRSNNKISPV